MQTQIKCSGTFSPDKGGHQPKHYSERHGSMFFCECSICRIRTASYPSHQEAIREWEAANYQNIPQRAMA